MDQLRLIRETDWDTLIILDACRYDMFEQVYKDYLPGEATKAISPAGSTHTWLPRVFGDKHPFTVYSAHPGINSRDEPVFGYKSRDHFIKVLDLWETSWDNERGGSLPDIINERVKEHLDNGTYVGKNILWYMQPHFPWLGSDIFDAGGIKGRMSWNRKAYDDLKHGKYPRDLMVKGYTDNLRYVLGYVKELLLYLEGNVVVTSDHGELLADAGLPADFQFGHYEALYEERKELREVPWLKIV